MIRRKPPPVREGVFFFQGGSMFPVKTVFLFGRQVRGATAIEYTLIAAGIALAIAAVVFTMGEDLAGMMDDIITALEGREPLP